LIRAAFNHDDGLRFALKDRGPAKPDTPGQEVQEPAMLDLVINQVSIMARSRLRSSIWFGAADDRDF